MKIKGQDLYKKAKKIIPGGNMLLSKRPNVSSENGHHIFQSQGGKYLGS